MFGFRARGTLFCQGTSFGFEMQVHWRWHYWHAWVSSLQHFRGLRGKDFPTDSRHSNGHQLCPPLLVDIFLYSHEAEFIQSSLSAGKKQLASQFNFTYRYIHEVLSINNPYLENDIGQMYLAELEIKDTTFTPPDTWSCPICDLHFFLMLRSFIPELAIPPDLLSFEHPSISLSHFSSTCFNILSWSMA